MQRTVLSGGAPGRGPPYGRARRYQSFNSDLPAGRPERAEEGRIEFSCCAMRFAELAMSMVRAGDCAQSSLVVSELHRPVPTYVHLCTECKAITFQAS